MRLAGQIASCVEDVEGLAPPKFNMAPEKWRVEDESFILYKWSLFRGYVKWCGLKNGWWNMVNFAPLKPFLLPLAWIFQGFTERRDHVTGQRRRVDVLWLVPMEMRYIIYYLDRNKYTRRKLENVNKNGNKQSKPSDSTWLFDPVVGGQLIFESITEPSQMWQRIARQEGCDKDVFLAKSDYKCIYIYIHSMLCLTLTKNRNIAAAIEISMALCFTPQVQLLCFTTEALEQKSISL